MENHYDFSRSIHYFSLHVSGSQTLNVDQAGYINPIQFHSTTNHKPSSKITIFLWFSYGFPMVFLWFSPFSYGKTSIHHPFTSVFLGDSPVPGRWCHLPAAVHRVPWPASPCPCRKCHRCRSPCRCSMASSGCRAREPERRGGKVGDFMVILWWFYGDFYWDFI
jgi:hypothetical protein